MAVPTITVIGNLGTDPELRTSANGNAYVRIFVIASSRRLNRQTNEWEDSDHVALGGVAFGDLAQHISDSLSKGMRVIVQGRLRESRPNPNQADSSGSPELLIDDIGPALSNATAQVTKVSGGSGFSGGGRGGFQGNSGNGSRNSGSQGGYRGGASTSPASSSQPAQDPWSSGSSDSGSTSFGASGGFNGGFGSDSDEPEF